VNIRERLEAMLKPNADGLLPCPWCGATDAHNHLHEFAIMCRRCSARGQFVPNENKRVELWNSRPFLRALLLAIEQRDDWIACDPSLDEAELAAEIAKYDVPLLAILDGKESP
jgi:hypothetical protein